jgi:hypothetical protein
VSGLLRVPTVPRKRSVVARSTRPMMLTQVHKPKLAARHLRWHLKRGL